MNQNGKRKLCQNFLNMSNKNKDWVVLTCFSPLVGDKIIVEKDESGALEICEIYANGIPFSGKKICFTYFKNIYFNDNYTKKVSSTSKIHNSTICSGRKIYYYDISLQEHACNVTIWTEKFSNCIQKCYEINCMCLSYNFNGKRCCLNNKDCGDLTNFFHVKKNSILGNKLMILPLNCSNKC